MDRIKDITAKLVETKDWPEFGAGDTVTVTLKIKEGNKNAFRHSKAWSFSAVDLERQRRSPSARLPAASVSSASSPSLLPLWTALW